MKVKITKVPDQYKGYSNNLFADGGVFEGLHTNGVDFKNPGDFREINTGSSHELNGNQGVPQGVDNEGTPNLVEEDEVVYNNYVFSARLTVPTKDELNKELKNLPESEGGDSQRGWEIKVLKKYAGKTYADAAKKSFKIVEERPNDPIAKSSFDTELGVLANSQEKQRAIEKVEDQKDELKELSDQEFVEAQHAQEQQQAMQEAAMEQQAQQQMQAEQQQQMSPEEQAMMQQQQMQQAPQMANGGHLFEDGGELQKQMQLASMYYQYLQQSNNPDKIKAIQARMSQYAQQIQQLPQDQQQSAMQQAQMQCLYEAATQDQDFINTINQQSQDIYAKGGNMNDTSATDTPQMEEGTHEELTGINPTQDVEEMSTSQLNETIDQIYQWAKQNGNRDLAKRARKAKKFNRDEKEDFVDDAMQDIEEYRAQQQEQQRVEQQEQTSPEAQVQHQQMQQAAQKQQSEQMAAQELNANMQQPQEEGTQFAMGGSMNLNNPNSGQNTNNKKLFAGPPIDVTKQTEGNTTKDEESTILSARKHHKPLFQEAINAFAQQHIDAISSLIEEGKIAEARAARQNFINKWNNINNAYSNMEVGNKESVKSLQQLFDAEGLNINVDDVLNNTVNLTTRKKKTPYKKDNPIDGDLGDITAGRFLDVDTLSPELYNFFKTYGIDSTPWGQDINTNFYSRLSSAVGDKDMILNPEWEKYQKLTPQEIASTPTPDKYIPIQDWLNTEGTPLYNKETPIDWSKLSDEQKALLFTKGDLTPSDINTDQQLWSYTPKADTKVDNEDITDDANKSKTDEYKLPSDWPMWAGIGLQGATALHNILSPTDYSNAEAMLSLARDRGYERISPEYIGDYLAPRRFDPYIAMNRANATNAATRRQLANLSGGNRAQAMANILASDQQYIAGLGELARQGQLFNAEREMQEAQFNRGTNQFNAEAAMKAAMANQEAAARASSLNAELSAKGIAMREAADQAKANAINVGITGLTGALGDLYKNRYTNYQTKWLLEHGYAPNITSSGSSSKQGANGGKIRTRRKKGLTY